MTTGGSSTPTIVLIHGFWVTPLIWEQWKAHYEAKGHRVLTPGYPGLDTDIEALRADPAPIERLSVGEIIANLEQLILSLDEPPIIIGHAAGGAFAQILLGRGLGQAGIAINSAPPQAVGVTPFSEITPFLPVLRSLADRHRAGSLTPQQWSTIFANTMTAEESGALYERHHIPASGRLVWESTLASISLGHHGVHVDYRNDTRAPLLLVSGKRDLLYPPKVGQANARRYSSEAVTEHIEFDGPHLLIAAPNWTTVAEYVLDWALTPNVTTAGHAWAVDPSLTSIRRD